MAIPSSSLSGEITDRTRCIYVAGEGWVPLTEIRLQVNQAFDKWLRKQKEKEIKNGDIKRATG